MYHHHVQAQVRLKDLEDGYNCREERSVNQIGSKIRIDKGKQFVFDVLLEKMPMHMGEVIKQEKYFCVKNIRK